MVRIDNSYLKLKADLRLKFLPQKKIINVLDCFCGMGVIWEEVSKNCKSEINVIGIDKKKESKADLIGDNVKYLRSLDLSKYDVIDLDAYGIPFEQLEILFERKYNGLLFITFITFYGINFKLLNYLGFSNIMINKCKSIFFKNPFEKFKAYLYLKGIRKIYYYEIDKKYYIFINLEKDEIK